MRRAVYYWFFLLATLAASSAILAQAGSPDAGGGTAGFADDYPTNQAGVLIHGSTWQPVANAMPFKTKVAHGIAASFSYGAVPAKLVAEYAGEHAATQVDAGQVTLCVCHLASIPGEPVIVRLHPKKGERELDGGRMAVYPVVGGSKVADASKSDLIAVDQAHPSPAIWLIRPQGPLPPGEYALMLGTQNISIFPFSVTEPAASGGGAKPNP